ncbi:MAG: glycosyltransferase, partial [archaeon]
MLSVCVPIYNEEENVERIVKNIQETDLWKRSRQKEILLGINGSTDHSAAIARRMARADPRIRVFIIPEKSKNKAWEKMVQESNPISERLFFADADVILESSTFSRINEAMEKSPTMAVIG